MSSSFHFPYPAEVIAQSAQFEAPESTNSAICLVVYTVLDVSPCSLLLTPNSAAHYPSPRP
ncbi:hypothetical protein FA13DRAFT_1740226 [Coprinellus micaceus]|uniref:Uncharacterized protein n=1 Tax=Coprinellus micaceus TaxID=71717 RepID=A0A4Y7SPV1_COPMI|nr:hypothetical protein FA13DRAFT_1740226 [Coprinellus micaceus]